MPNNSNYLFLTPEIQALINLGKASFLQNKKADFDKFSAKSTLNWDKIYTLAQFHQIRPLILRGVTNTSYEGISDSFLIKLKQDCLHLTFHGLHQTTELLRLLNLYKQNNILAIPYKGVWLANTYYGGWGMREFSDIDLFIYEHDMNKLKSIMLKEGYVPQMILTPEQETMMMRILCEYNFDFFGKDGKRLFHVEPHFKSNGISDNLNHLTLNDLEHRLMDMPFSNTTISSFSPEDNLLLIVIHHGVKEGWTLLKYLFDVYAILLKEQNSIDWNYVLLKSQELKITNSLFIGLNLIQNLFEFDLPNTLKMAIQQPKIQDLAHKRCLSFDNIKVKNRQFTLFLFNLKCMDSCIDRLKIIIHRLFYPHLADILFISLSPRWSFLYFFLRPLRGLWKLIKPNAPNTEG